MKRTFLITVVLSLAALFSSCNKDDTQKPSITWPSNEKFSQMELGPKADGALSVAAPAGFQSITIALGLGEYNVLANNHIATTANQGDSKRSAIFDIIDDSKVVSFLQGLGQAAGTSLRGKTITTIDLIDILETLIENQDNIKNNTSFIIDVTVIDKSGNKLVKTAKFHFTAPPTITPDSSFENGILNLGTASSAKVRIQAPGKIAKLQLYLDSAAPFVLDYIKNRTTGGIQLIDLINDEKVAESFKDSFPAGAAVDGKTDVSLDFSFLIPLRFSFPGTTSVFTINCEDVNGKTCSIQLKFVS